MLSFIGAVPIENPEVVCYVIVDTPEEEPDNSAYATKFFNRIMSEVLPYMNIEKTEPDDEWDRAKKETETTDEVAADQEGNTSDLPDDNGNYDEGYSDAADYSDDYSDENSDVVDYSDDYSNDGNDDYYYDDSGDDYSDDNADYDYNNDVNYDYDDNADY